MLKDIQDSVRLNGVVRKNQQLEPGTYEFQHARGLNFEDDSENPEAEGFLRTSLHAKNPFKVVLASAPG